MEEIYTSILAVFIVLSGITGIIVLLKRNMPGSKTGGILILFGAAWSSAYYYQLISMFSEDIIFWFLLKQSISYIIPALFVVYLHRFFEFKEPKWVQYSILLLPSTFSLLQLLPRFKELLYSELIIYNQIHVAPKYTMFGLVPIFYTYLMSIGLFGYFIKTLISKQNILKIRVTAFMIVASLYELTYALDLLNSYIVGFEVTPLLFNIVSIGIALFSTERLYRRDVLPSVFDAMIKEIDDLIIVTDDVDRVIFLNDKAREITRCKNVGFLDHYIWEVFPSLTIGSGERIQTLSANEKTYDIQTFGLQDWQNNNRSTVYVLRDISELVEYQYNLETLVEVKTHELMESERMATIGETTLMVGHDLRNPLQVLQLLTYQLRKVIDHSDSTETILDRIDSNVTYMDKIVSDLTLYAKKTEPNIQRVKLIDLLEHCLSTLNIPDNVILDYDFTFDFEFSADPYMIERVLNNLILNALQAMPDGGIIQIGANKEGDQSVITLTDSGSGISEEIRDTLFTPLVTTKPKGVGMGLAVCKKIVDMHNGDIHVDSNDGGTSFVINVPEFV